MPPAATNAQFLQGRLATSTLGSRTASSRVGVSLAVVVHLAILLIVSRTLPNRSPTAAVARVAPPANLVWLVSPQQGQGGGGGGDDDPSPATAAQSPGHDATTLRIVRPATMPVPGTPEPPSTRVVEVPAVSTAAGLDDLPGVMAAKPSTEVASRGPGSGPGADGGRGPGSGPGTGPGLGPGEDGNQGGGPMQPGGDVSWPRLLRDVKPQYTVDALRARAQGLIELRVVVLADGSVGGVDIVRGFQPPFGLDSEAIKAVRNWRFDPARQRGRPVAVVVPVELSFSLR